MAISKITNDGIGDIDELTVDTDTLVVDSTNNRVRAGANVNNEVTFSRSLQARNAMVTGFSGTGEAQLYIHRDDVTISSGNTLGEINFSGADGGSYVGASVKGVAAGSWGSTSAPANITFDTTAAGSTSPTERMRIDSDGNLQHLSKPAYFARAWVNFNGTGTVSIRNSGNVSSVTDNGTGQYTVNLTTSIASNAASISDGNLGGYNRASTSRMISTTACEVYSWNTGTNALADLTYIDVAIFG
jgi:hypothetical protein